MARFAPLLGDMAPQPTVRCSESPQSDTLRVSLWMWDETAQAAGISGHSGTAVLGFPVSAEYILAARRGEDVSGIAVGSMLQYGRVRLLAS